MKALLMAGLFTLSFSAVAGTQFYKIRPKVMGGTKGFEIVYNAETKKCAKEFWDGSKHDRASEDVSIRKCQGYIDGLALKEKKGGNCTAQGKVIDITTILGVTGKKEIRLSEDCYCYKTEYAVGHDSADAEFEKISECEETFGKIL